MRVRRQRRRSRDAESVEGMVLGRDVPLPQPIAETGGECRELPNRFEADPRPQTPLQHFLSVTDRFR